MGNGSPLRALAAVRPPKQARSEQTLQRLLDTAERLILQRGVAEVSVPAIVRGARSSIGSFYARFDDKDALLRALEERFFQRVHARLEQLLDGARWEGIATHAAIHAFALALIDEVQRHGPLLQAFAYRAARAADEALREESQRFREHVRARLRAFLLARRGEFTHPDLARAADFTLAMTFACIQGQILGGNAATLPGDDGHGVLAGEMSRMFLAYLGYRPLHSGDLST